MLASLLLDLAGGKVGPHKGGNRLIAMRSKAQAILETSGTMGALPRTLALELKAELIRPLCDELLANHDRIIRLERMLREQLLPATKQTITTITGISTILAATIIGETGSITRFRSPAAFAVYNGTAPARNSTGGRNRHKARRDCNHRLKRAFYLAARAAVLHDPLAKAYHQSCKSRGLSYVEALKRVARRCLTWSMPCSNQARPTIVRSSSMPSNVAGSRRHTRHAAMRNKALSTPDQGNPTRRSRSSK
jgi:transposase